jgi:hypothetical protein
VKEAAKVEREARKAAKAAEKALALARGRGRARGARSRGRGGRGGRGRGHGSETRDSADEEESSAQSDSSDESQLDDAVVDANAGASEIESSDDEDAHGDPFVAVDGPPSAASPPPAVEDESDDDDESAGGETEIASFNGHRWESRRHLEFQVIWMDGDITWERLSNVNDCAAMEQYLAHHDLDDPLLLSRRKFLLNNKIQAINE